MLRALVIVFLLLSQEVFSQSLIQNILNQTNLDSLLQNVRDLSGVNPVVVNGSQTTIVSRNKSNAANAIAADYIKQRLNGYGIPATIESFSSTCANVMGVQRGTKFPNKKFIICAHFDNMPSGATAPGADDNGSGTAAVIEAARIFSQYSFPYTIVYALWDEEEQGLVGSAYYANQAAAAGDSILGVINLDMIAYEQNGDNLANIHTKSTGISVAMANKMVELIQQYNLGLTTTITNPGITASDHASFWNKNYSAILLIEDYNGGDFNAYYHTVNDKITAFNNPYFLKMSKAAFATLAYYALNVSFNIEHTPIASRSYQTNITATAKIYSGASVGTGPAAPRLYYRVRTINGTTPFSFVPGVVSAPDTYSFTLPVITNLAQVEYYIAAQDSAGLSSMTQPAGGGGINPPGTTPPANLYSFYTSDPVTMFSDSANQISKWTASGGWAAVTNKYVSAPASMNESPGGNYPNSITYTLTSQPVMLPQPLSALVTYTIMYDAQWDIEDKYDYCQIQISSDAGSTWQSLAGMYTTTGTNNQPVEPLYDGTQGTWVKENIIIPAMYNGRTVQFRFFFKSDVSLAFDGFYFDNFNVAGYFVVPVELTSFTATSVPGKNILQWKTASELNNRDFLIERMDGNNWKQIGVVQGNGTTTQPHTYSYTDNIGREGVYTYRLVQRDYNGTFHPSFAVTVNTLSEIADYVLYANYPNPFNPATVIKFDVPSSGNVTLRVYDMLGSEVAVLLNGNIESGHHSVTFNAHNLSGGVYIYELKAGTTTLRKKMNLLK